MNHEIFIEVETGLDGQGGKGKGEEDGVREGDGV